MHARKIECSAKFLKIGPLIYNLHIERDPIFSTIFHISRTTYLILIFGMVGIQEKPEIPIMGLLTSKGLSDFVFQILAQMKKFYQ